MGWMVLVGNGVSVAKEGINEMGKPPHATATIRMKIIDK
jgi:hypothetical protein